MDLSSSSNCPPTPPHLEGCPATPTRLPAFKSNSGSPNPSDDSSNEGRLSVASDNADNRASPPPNCAICLYKCKNKCFTDSCLHQFCFTCLLQWSKVKPECPLCKQSFKSIIHNVRSNDDYEEYLVRPTITTIAEPLLVTNYHLPHADRVGQRYRFRTTLNIQRQEEIALQNYLMDHPLTNSFMLSSNPFFDVSVRNTSLRRARHSNQAGSDFRSVVYRSNLWATPLPDITGRFRECSAHFYRNNPAQKHRLMPWLDRELKVLLNQNQPHMSYVLGIISELIPVHDINSAQFRSAISPYFTNNTDHFVHEFYQFARSPFDMIGYDRDVQYVSEEYLMGTTPSVISSSSDSDDSDVRIISPDATPALNLMVNNDDSVIYVNDESTSVMLTSEPRVDNSSNSQNNGLDSFISIETISPTSSDDDSDACVITGVVKPPQDRTPELVTLDTDNDDTDVVSVHSEAERSSVSNWSDNNNVSQLNQPSTSRAWNRKRKFPPASRTRPKSPPAYRSSSDSDSDFNLPLAAYQKSMSEILLKRFQDGQQNRKPDSDSEDHGHKKKKLNSKKGKSLVRNGTASSSKTGNRSSNEKRTYESSSTTEHDTSSNSSSSREKKCKLKSVVVKKDDNMAADDPITVNLPNSNGHTFDESESSEINVTDESNFQEDINF